MWWLGDLPATLSYGSREVVVHHAIREAGSDLVGYLHDGWTEAGMYHLTHVVDRVDLLGSLYNG